MLRVKFQYTNILASVRVVFVAEQIVLSQRQVYSPRSPIVLLDFSLTVKAVPHESVIRTSQP